MLSLAACTDESLTENTKGTYISIRLFPESGNTTRINPGDDHEGEFPDNVVQTLRILTFDRGNGTLKANDQYDIINSALDVIKHPALAGTYDLVFLANEPLGTDSRLGSISTLSDLKKMSYDVGAFASDQAIPMMQVIENVEITSDGKIELINGTLNNINGKPRSRNTSKGIYNPGEETDLLILSLDRLAVRLNILLKSVSDLENDFESLLLANIPDVVPLFQDDYSEEITRNTTYEFEKNKFTNADPLPDGTNWAMYLSRIILPASYADSDKDAIILTAKFNNKYSPSCKLMIEKNNYNLPYNTWLNFEGIVKEPLEMNIVAKDWNRIQEEWNTEPIYLNLSQTEVNITDYNGARITFESNGASVRVTGFYQNNVYSDWVNGVFNQVQWGEAWNKRYNYEYNSNTQTGSGYMDLIVNNIIDTNGTYILQLTARRKETWDGAGMSLTRSIKVNVRQEGLRQRFEIPSSDKQYSSSIYVGAFYKNDEVGERIIQGRFTGSWWEATVPNEEIPGSGKPTDWIVISSTPSFDPKVGTNDPGNAELYEVAPNDYRGENGFKVIGTQRVYFRIGLTSKNTRGVPRYARIKFRYIEGEKSIEAVPGENDTRVKFKKDKEEDPDEYEDIKVWYIYVRQGEEPDKVLDESTPVYSTEAPNTIINGVSRGAIRRFAPYNVTVQDMLTNYDNMTNNFITVDSTRVDGSRSTVFVKYPTQGGALFQWAVPVENYRRRAYYIRSITDDEFTSSSGIWNWTYNYSRDPFWEVPSGSNLMPYKKYGEVCPENYQYGGVPSQTYRRPNNGIIASELAKNNTIQEVANSEFLSSLFMEIPVGDAHTDIYQEVYPIVRYTPKPISNAPTGFYADGFFDRHPIQSKLREDGWVEGVCLNDTRAAFRGALFYNPITCASIFFPSAGRRDSDTGALQYNGGTGFYQTTSLGNQWVDRKGNTFKNAWQMELSYHPAAISAVLGFASSLRCVVDE